MNKEVEAGCGAVGAPVEPSVRPAAWIQHHKAGDNLEWEDPGGKRTALYTQADIDAAVAAERDRMRDLCAIDMASATLKASELAQAAERERLRVTLMAHRDRTVMSCYASLRECDAARNALQRVLDELA